MKNQYILPVKIILNPPDRFFIGVYLKTYNYLSTGYKVKKMYNGISSVRFPGFYNEEDYKELNTSSTYLFWNRSNYNADLVFFNIEESKKATSLYVILPEKINKIIKYLNSMYLVKEPHVAYNSLFNFPSKPNMVIEKLEINQSLRKVFECQALNTNNMSYIGYKSWYNIKKTLFIKIFTNEYNKKQKLKSNVTSLNEVLISGIEYSIQKYHDFSSIVFDKFCTVGTAGYNMVLDGYLSKNCIKLYPSVNTEDVYSKLLYLNIN